jgi:hypothetical protein
MHGKPGGKGKQPMPGGKGRGCMLLTGLQGLLLLPCCTVVKQDPLGLDARSNCRGKQAAGRRVMCGGAGFSSGHCAAWV